MLLSRRTLYVCLFFTVCFFTFLILCLSICLSRFNYYSDVIGCAVLSVQYVCAFYMYYLECVLYCIYLSICLSRPSYYSDILSN